VKPAKAEAGASREGSKTAEGPASPTVRRPFPGDNHAAGRLRPMYKYGSRPRLCRRQMSVRSLVSSMMLPELTNKGFADLVLIAVTTFHFN
jgi:hypothetical protein